MTFPVTNVYGLLAALAVLERRPEQVVRIVHTAAARKPLAEALREAARRRIAYREVGDDELSRIADATHHEGVCVMARRQEPPTLEALATSVSPTGLLCALDNVSNPHNVGALLRTAAFFGVGGLLVGDPKRQTLTGAAVRIAEGGAEHVPVLHVAELHNALESLRSQGIGIVGADGQAKTPLHELRWPTRTVLVLGNEEHGLGAAVQKRCDTVVSVPGKGALQSLNVSVAAGILIASCVNAQRGFLDRVDRVDSRRRG